LKPYSYAGLLDVLCKLSRKEIDTEATAVARLLAEDVNLLRVG
jgi:hypothetical protein